MNLLSKLRDKYDQWWYFLDHPEVPPDNNLAERSLRLAVTKRKIGGGSRYAGDGVGGAYRLKGSVIRQTY